jgi:hypothetical protein
MYRTARLAIRNRAGLPLLPLPEAHREGAYQYQELDGPTRNRRFHSRIYVDLGLLTRPVGVSKAQAG